MSDISANQNEEANLRYQLAASHFYGLGKWIHSCGALFTIVLALISPLVLLYRPSYGPMLGAIAGAWLFASRLVLEPIKRELQLKGATAQELFDCAVLRLPWNDALVRRISEEEIHRASAGMRNVENARDWYPASETMPWPKSVVVCQRSNNVWAGRQHRTFALVLRIAAVVWWAIGVIVAVLHDASLGQYLVTIALPSLPALLDSSELARLHATAAESRMLLRDQTDEMFRSRNTTIGDLREMQDQLFDLRRDAPLVPQWFYRLIRKRYEEDMRYAAQRAHADDQGKP